MSPNKPLSRIAIVGAGAVGGWVGARLAEAGHDIVLIDAWPEHVAAMQENGIAITEGGTTTRTPVTALHVGQVQDLYRQPVDIAIISVKLYDTEWASALIAPYLAPGGYVVTLQNSLVEDVIAARVGWARTVGCIGSSLHVRLDGPGHVVRTQRPGKRRGTAFYVGEVHGRVTPRIEHLVQLLEHVDGAQATTNLWGMRWAKLVANAMTSALCAASGLSMKAMFSNPATRQALIGLADEAVRVGLALGYDVEQVFGLAPSVWMAAAASEPQALLDVKALFQAQADLLTEDALSGTAQDIAKKRRTEVEYMNGYVAARAAEAGLNAPMHAALADLVREMERGRLSPGLVRVQDLVTPSAPHKA